MPSSRVSESEWTLWVCPKCRSVMDDMGQTASYCWHEYRVERERVVVARPSDTAKRIAEGIREQTKHRYWGADTRLAIADWIERECGGERALLRKANDPLSGSSNKEKR